MKIYLITFVCCILFLDTFAEFGIEKKGEAWVISIGINDCGAKLDGDYNNCESDAISYNQLFKNHHNSKDSSYHEYLLIGKNATKEALLNVLSDIAKRAAREDYFILNFCGNTEPFETKEGLKNTYFFLFSDTQYRAFNEDTSIKKSDKFDEFFDPEENPLISLKVLQEHINQIPAINQLFITEAGYSYKFKTECLKTMMSGSTEVANILNKNQVIIIPNNFGWDQIRCGKLAIKKGPINYFLTSLNAANENIFDIFERSGEEMVLSAKIMSKAFSCSYFNYFEIFFLRKFLEIHNELSISKNYSTRGIDITSVQSELIWEKKGQKYALLIGSNQYSAPEWKQLSNPIPDVKSVAKVLDTIYGYKTTILENAPMDTLYKKLSEYYKILSPDDDFIIYFAGHGDMEEHILSDGFIVCSDSKSLQVDPFRNTYISYTRLKKMLNNLPARHVLVLLDVCHGGTFNDKAFNNVKRLGNQSNTTLNSNVMDFLAKTMPLRTRKFLSSVGIEPAFDGAAGNHSPFANLLLNVLLAKGINTNQIVTLTSINAVLQSAANNETATLRIAPDMSNFGDVDPFGEFVLIPKPME